MSPFPSSFSGTVRENERLDAAIKLRREHVVTLGDVLEGDEVVDDGTRLEVATAHVLEQARPLALHRALVHPQGEALVEGVAELHRAEDRTVRAHHRHGATL